MGRILDLPVESEDEDDVPMTQPMTGYNKTFTLLPFRNGIKVTRKMVELDQWDMIQAMMGGLFNTYKWKLEYQYSNVFNTAFTTAGADGANLFSDSHQHVDGSAGTWDNLEAAAELSADTYSTMRLNMRNRTNEKGYVQPLMLNELVVVNDLERKAKEVLGSVRTADTDLNNEFAFHGESNIVVWDWLTSTTAFFGRDAKAPTIDQGLYEFCQAPAEVMDNTSDYGIDILFARRLRFANAVGATDLKAWNGSVGA